MRLPGASPPVMSMARMPAMTFSVTVGCPRGASVGGEKRGVITWMGVGDARSRLKRNAWAVGSIDRGGNGRRSVGEIRQQQRQDRRRQEQKARVKQCVAVVAELLEEAEEDDPSCRDDAPDVVAEARARGSEQGRKERGQVHGEEREDPLKEAGQGEPPVELGVGPLDSVGPCHR